MKFVTRPQLKVKGLCVGTVGKHTKTSFPAMNSLITFSCSFLSEENLIALVALVTTDIIIRIIIIIIQFGAINQVKYFPGINLIVLHSTVRAVQVVV